MHFLMGSSILGVGDGTVLLCNHDDSGYRSKELRLPLHHCPPGICCYFDYFIKVQLLLLRNLNTTNNLRGSSLPGPLEHPCWGWSAMRVPTTFRERRAVQEGIVAGLRGKVTSATQIEREFHSIGLGSIVDHLHKLTVVGTRDLVDMSGELSIEQKPYGYITYIGYYLKSHGAYLAVSKGILHFEEIYSFEDYEIFYC